MATPLDEFLKIKQAGFGDAFRAAWRGGDAVGLGGALGAHLPAALVGAGVAGAGGLIAHGFEAIRDRLTKARDYKSMLQATPDLKHFDASHTQMMYNSLRSLAPSLASDPLVAGSFVRDALRLSPEHGPAIPPATAKMLVDTQAKLDHPGLMGSMVEAMGKASPTQRIKPPDAPKTQNYEEVRHYDVPKDKKGRPFVDQKGKPLGAQHVGTTRTYK